MHTFVRWLLTLLLVFILIGGFFAGAYWYFFIRVPDENLGTSPKAMGPESASEEIESKEVRLFFRGVPGDALLVAETQTVYASKRKSSLAMELIQALIRGPEKKGLAILPKTCSLRQLFVLEDLVVVDFPQDAMRDLKGSVWNEMALVQGISNTLTANVPGIHRVRILVDGVQRETLAGHVSVQEEIRWSQEALASPISSNSE